MFRMACLAAIVIYLVCAPPYIRIKDPQYPLGMSDVEIEEAQHPDQ